MLIPINIVSYLIILDDCSFDRPFEEVVYPKGDADAVSISKRDFDLLQPDTFVNDTIIDFYIKYVNLSFYCLMVLEEKNYNVF